FSAALRNAAESAEAKRARARDSRAVGGLIAAEAGRFALFAGVAGVLLASGLAALVVAAVVAIVYGWPWLFPAAGLLLAASGVTGARTAIELLAWKHVLSRPWK